MKSNLENFQEHVSLKFNIYNSIFQTLGLSGVNKTGILMPIFENYCRENLSQDKNPVEIVDSFLEEYVQQTNEETTTDVLFRFIKYIERQVVLVDSLEDAAFGQINDLEGSGSFKSFYETAENRHALDTLESSLDELKVRLVLTAHPTQFYPGPVLGIIKDLSEAIKNNNLTDIKQLLFQLGYTPFFKKEKPTPYDEAVSLIWFLENLFYHSIPSIYEQMAKQLGTSIEQFANSASSFQLGFWPGGDRDGNPFVNSDITLKVADRLRTSVLKCYYRDVRKLKRKLTFRKVEPLMTELEHLLYEGGFLDLVGPDFNETKLTQQIDEVIDILKTEYKGVYLDEMLDLKLKVKAFGFHFATLDIRQDNQTIKQAFDELRALNPYVFDNFDTHDLGAYFSKTGKCNSINIDDPVLQDTIDVFSTMKEIVDRNGKYGAYRFIISNCNSARSIARVYLMARLLAFPENLPLDVIPLFETIGDLQKASDTMESLYNNPNYRAHLNRRSNKQVIMLGFSDGTKDGGYITANWSIYKAKEEITRISREYGVTAVFFDGRGGPPARGGGNTHKFYASMGQNIESEEIQLTVQGQTISSNFGTFDSCRFNIEQLYTAGLENKVFEDKDKSLDENQRALIEELSKLSGDAYLEFKEHPKFIPYLENRSTLRFYNKANIGSRPSKRGRDSKLTLKDLRAIPFVGAWSQLKQNVPGFFGLGTAFEAIENAGRLEEVQNLYKNNLFFKTLLENSMQSLCKTYFPLTSYMRKDEEYGDFWELIHEEYQKSYAYILKITGQPELLATNLGIKESIKLRERIVMPLLVIQQYALIKIKEIEQGKIKEDADVYEKLVIRSLYGNINASRNSA